MKSTKMCWVKSLMAVAMIVSFSNFVHADEAMMKNDNSAMQNDSMMKSDDKMMNADGNAMMAQNNAMTNSMDNGTMDNHGEMMQDNKMSK